jgi:DNA-binding NarL/FixJ family response regulator
MAKIKIVLTDDHPLHVEGLVMLLKKQTDFEVCAWFTNAADLKAYAEKNEFDVLLLDLHMPGEDGLQTAEKFFEKKHPAKIILLTMQRGGRFMQKAEKLNVKGYLLKNIGVDLLVEKIREVYKGGTCFDDSLKNFKLEDDIALKSSVIVDDKPDTILSDREKEILILVCKEYSSSQIAEKLFISTGTVDTHRKNLLVKLSVNNTVGLVKYALKHGLLND